MPDLSCFAPTSFSLLKEFSFTVFKGLYTTKITMECAPTVVNTSQFPDMYELLHRHLPSVFNTKCYNDQNYPFIVEVKRTEIAHLFEHIMLEYICQYKMAEGARQVSVSGTTDWNWKKDPFGTFHITIRVGKKEDDIFNEALEKTLELFKVLVNRQSVYMEKQMVA